MVGWGEKGKKLVWLKTEVLSGHSSSPCGNKVSKGHRIVWSGPGPNNTATSSPKGLKVYAHSPPNKGQLCNIKSSQLWGKFLGVFSWTHKGWRQSLYPLDLGSWALRAHSEAEAPVSPKIEGPRCTARRGAVMRNTCRMCDITQSCHIPHAGPPQC